MTHPADLRADLMRTVTECAANIVADLERQNISTQSGIAIAATVVGMLADQLPAEQRVAFCQAFARDLLRVPRLDA